MFFESLSWVILTLTLLVTLPGALAAPSQKKSKKFSSTRVTVETYPAMEDGEIIVPPSSRRVQTLGAPVSAAPVAVAAAPIAEPVAVIAPAPAAKVIAKFEVVPAEKRAQIVQRMTLCQSLFVETGRAYDYRTTTTAELQKELDAVRAGKAVAAVQAAPVVKAEVEPDPILDAASEPTDL